MNNEPNGMNPVPPPGPTGPAGPSRPYTPPIGPPRRPDARPSPFYSCLFAVSVLLNIGAGVVVILVCCGGLFFGRGFGSSGEDNNLTERVVSGNASAKDKVAVIQLDGIIMEGSLGYVHKQIDQAGKDKQVKAVVVRINSPGGSITASDELHRRFAELKTGNSRKKYDPKPLVVSMGSMAASGGYYVAMPGQVIYAEPTTMTGSIGVYGAFLDLHGIMKKYEIAMNVIKAGEIKDGGSPFKEMSDKERQVWQEMINEAYGQFLDVVETARPDLKDKLLSRFDVTPVAPGGDKEIAAKPHQRYLADGGVFTAVSAKKKGLIDKIGTLDDAIDEAHTLANLSEDYKAVEYLRPHPLLELLRSIETTKPAGLSSPLLDPGRLRNGLTPRLWYLAPGCEFAGMLAAVDAEK
jgi:protease-4